LSNTVVAESDENGYSKLIMDAVIIEKEAMQLPESERAVLADRLLESISSIPSGLRKIWVREADERMQAFREGKIEALNGPAAMAELRSRFE
jgi:hypothetical protein